MAFHANITANEIKQMADIAKNIPGRHITNGKDATLDVVVYSGYAGLGIYQPSSMDYMGNLVEKYGVDWEVVSAAGLSVAMVGCEYNNARSFASVCPDQALLSTDGDHSITPILDAIAKGKRGSNNSCPLVCGVISGTQVLIRNPYHTY